LCCDTENAHVLRQCLTARLVACPPGRLPAARLPACPTARLPACPPACLPPCPPARLPFNQKKLSDGIGLWPYRFTNSLRMRIVLWGALSFAVRSKLSNCSPRNRQKIIEMQFSLSSEVRAVFTKP